MGKEPKTFNQEYRDNLAAKLREKRSEADSGKEDAQKILEHEKKGVFYNDAERDYREGDQFETRRGSFDKRMEPLKKEAEKFGYTLNIEDFDSEKEMFLERVKAEVAIGEKIGKKLTLVENRIRETKFEEEKNDLENSEEAFSYIQNESLANAEVAYDFVENDEKKDKTMTDISKEKTETDIFEPNTKEEQKSEFSGDQIVEALRKEKEPKKETENKITEDKESLSPREKELKKIIDSAQKSLKWMKGKNSEFSTNSMISREERKFKDAESELKKLKTETKKEDDPLRIDGNVAYFDGAKEEDFNIHPQEDDSLTEKYQEPIEEKDLNIFPKEDETEEKINLGKNKNEDKEENNIVDLDETKEIDDVAEIKEKTTKDTEPYSGWDDETLVSTYKENLKLIDSLGENAAESLKTQVASIKKALEKRGLLDGEKKKSIDLKTKKTKEEVNSLLEKTNKKMKEVA